MKKAVAIDLDGTLCRDNTLIMFLKWLASHNGRCLPRLAWIVALRKFRVISHAEAKERTVRLAINAGVDVNKFVDQICRRLNPEVAKFARDKAEKGYAVILATAASALYAVILGKRLGFDAVVATNLGELESRGVEKKRRVEEICVDNGWQLTDAVSDHPDDLPLMSIPGVIPHWILPGKLQDIR